MRGAGPVGWGGEVVYAYFTADGGAVRVRFSVDEADRLAPAEGQRVRVALPGRPAAEVLVTAVRRVPPFAWVELAPLAEPALVPAAIAHALGTKERAGQGAESALLEQLQRKHMLLALDNFEHVLDGAPFVALLLEACPGLQVLATSRAPLRIRAEQQFPLEPLALPEDDDDVDAIACGNEGCDFLSSIQSDVWMWRWGDRAPGETIGSPRTNEP